MIREKPHDRFTHYRGKLVLPMFIWSEDVYLISSNQDK